MTNQVLTRQTLVPDVSEGHTMSYINPKFYGLITGKSIVGTSTPDYIDLDKRAEHIRYSYFLVKNYESKYHTASRVMFTDWKEGKISGPDYTKWVTAYLNVWDKIDES